VIVSSEFKANEAPSEIALYKVVVFNPSELLDLLGDTLMD
jgi:hypothetical protein